MLFSLHKVEHYFSEVYLAYIYISSWLPRLLPLLLPHLRLFRHPRGRALFATLSITPLMSAPSSVVAVATNSVTPIRSARPRNDARNVASLATVSRPSVCDARNTATSRQSAPFRDVLIAASLVTCQMRVSCCCIAQSVIAVVTLLKNAGIAKSATNVVISPTLAWFLNATSVERLATRENSVGTAHFASSMVIAQRIVSRPRIMKKFFALVTRPIALATHLL